MADSTSTGLGLKRSSSPTINTISKRLKVIADTHRFAEAADSPRVSRIIFDTSAGPRLGDPQFRAFYSGKVEEKRSSLALEGKRVVGCLAGLWFEDGIALNWVFDPSVKVEAEAPGPVTIFSSNPSAAQNGISAEDAIHVNNEEDELVASPHMISVEPIRTQVLELPDKLSSPIFAGDLPSGTSWTALLSLIPASFMEKNSPERVPQGSLSTPIYIDDSDSDVEGIEDLPSTTTPSDITIHQKTNTRTIEDEIPGLDEPEFEETLVNTLALADMVKAKFLPRKEPAPGGSLLERAFAEDWEEPSSDVAVDDEFSSDDDVPIGRKFDKPSVITNPSNNASPPDTTDQACKEGWSSESDESDSSRTSSAFQRETGTPFSRSKNSTRLTAGDDTFIQHSLANTQSSSRRKPPHQKSSRTASARPPDSIGHHATSSSGRESSSLVMLPSAPNAKPRRLLVPLNKGLALVTVTMRGDVNFIDPARNFTRISLWSIPNKGELRHVKDACMVGDTAVIGHDGRASQVSVIRLSKDTPPRQLDLRCLPHETGVSCVSALPYDPASLRFVTGGYDKRVCLWEMSDGVHTPKTEILPLVHNSVVQALSYRKVDQSILSGSGTNIFTTDLRKSQLFKKVKISNVVRHIHTHPQDANFSILEVEHLDCQIQLYDLRRGNHDRAPCIQFGYRTPGSKKTRHSKGSTSYHIFCKGYADGLVRLWDFRNPKEELHTVDWRPSPQPIAHTALSGGTTLAYGGGPSKTLTSQVVHFRHDLR